MPDYKAIVQSIIADHKTSESLEDFADKHGLTEQEYTKAKLIQLKWDEIQDMDLSDAGFSPAFLLDDSLSVNFNSQPDVTDLELVQISNDVKATTSTVSQFDISDEELVHFTKNKSITSTESNVSDQELVQALESFECSAIEQPPCKKQKTEQFPCSICQQTFTRNRDRTRHMRTQHSDPKFKCMTCDKLFRRKDQLKQHNRKHCGEDTVKAHLHWKCQLCSAAFQYLHDLQSHLDMHDREVVNSPLNVVPPDHLKISEGSKISEDTAIPGPSKIYETK